MAENDEMIGHRVGGIRRFEPITQLQCFAQRGLCEMHMVNVGAFANSGRCRLLFARGGFWRRLSVNKCSW